jgi:CRISPR/Cas system CSM-associated protein Csm3 (group 7 of RAMP superfamily)
MTEGWRNPRPIVERVEVRGELELQTPTHLGGGDPDPLSNVAMVLVRDPLDGRALLSGASIAGALRNYLREVSAGYEEGEGEEVTRLFGGSKGDDEGAQSPLIVDDARAEIKDVELRDGVRIEAATRTAAEGARFDIEVLAAGTTFPLHFELLIGEGESDALRRGLARALLGLEAGEIPLGARKRRGFGRCQVKMWTATRYKLTEAKGRGLIGWLEGQPLDQKSDPSIASALEVSLDERPDARHRLSLEAIFSLDGSLLVRSGFGEADSGPDMVHLHAIQPDGARRPVIPGTSLAGVIRHRALRIANTLRPGQGEKLVNDMFGSDVKGALTASRLVVHETTVEEGRSLVQNRVRIDRFTGGAFETALFEEEPLFGDDHSRLKVRLSLRNPQAYEIGLLLLVLKDLWTGDLPVGGGSSVGRGRLKGIDATLALLKQADQDQTWHIEQDGERLAVDRPGELGEYVKALRDQPWEVKK